MDQSHNPKHSGAGRVDQGQQPAAAKILEALLGKAEREVQEERRLQRLGHHIRPEDDPVEQCRSLPVYFSA
jgi:hypothetical protein